MYLTTKIHIANNTSGAEYQGTLKHLCFHAARMYNVGLYSVRQYFFETQKYLNYYDNYNLCKNNENYKLLYSSTAQQILRLVDRDMQSFFGLLKLKKAGKYSDKVKLPRYKKTDACGTYVMQGQACRIIDGKLRHGLSTTFRETYGNEHRYIELTIPKNVINNNIKEVRIIPLYDGTEFDIEFVYEQHEQPQSTASGVLSIDPGLSNLLTCTTFSSSKPSESFIIDGRYIKNINYYYNKQKAKLQSSYDLSGVKGTTSRMKRLSKGRNNRINQYFNLVVKHLVNYCVSNSIGTIVMGYNLEQKQEINTGRINNQNFVMIPMQKLRSKLASKCALAGIKLEFQEESYTSKACSLSLDDIPVYEAGVEPNVVFSGRRVKRGLYKSHGGELLNADVNGSINIYRNFLKSKSKADLSADGVRAFVNRPVSRISVIR